jgi:hypothetical protein
MVSPSGETTARGPAVSSISLFILVGTRNTPLSTNGFSLYLWRRIPVDFLDVSVNKIASFFELLVFHGMTVSSKNQAFFDPMVF